jgi:hypothetical protein
MWSVLILLAIAWLVLAILAWSWLVSAARADRWGARQVPAPPPPLVTPPARQRARPAARR